MGKLEYCYEREYFNVYSLYRENNTSCMADQYLITEKRITEKLDSLIGSENYSKNRYFWSLSIYEMHNEFSFNVEKHRVVKELRLELKREIGMGLTLKEIQNYLEEYNGLIENVLGSMTHLGGF